MLIFVFLLALKYLTVFQGVYTQKLSILISLRLGSLKKKMPIKIHLDKISL